MPKDEIKAKIKDYDMPPVISKLNDSGGLMAVAAPLGLVLIIVFIFVLAKCGKRCIGKYKICRKAFLKVKELIFFTALVRVILTSFLPIVVSSGIGNNFGSNPDPEFEVNWPQIAILAIITYLACMFVFFIDALEFRAADFK